MRLSPAIASALTTLLLTAAVSVSAQPPQAAATKQTDSAASPSTLSVDARLVNLPVVVRDKKDKLVQTLAKDDFRLQVDGHPQVIRYFDKDSNLPLTLGLLIDASSSQAKVIEDERAASADFLDQMLTADKDKAFIIQFSTEIDLLADLTGSRSVLKDALRQVQVAAPSPSDSNTSSVTPVGTPAGNPPSGNPNGGQPGNPTNYPGGGYPGGGYPGGGYPGGGYPGGGTTNNPNGGNTGGNNPPPAPTHTMITEKVLSDALFLASEDLMAKQQGRKAIIILSDGNDRNSKESLATAIEAAQRANVLVYAVYFKGEPPKTINPGQRTGISQGGQYPGGGYPGGYPGGGYPGGYPGRYPGGYPGGYPGQIPPGGGSQPSAGPSAAQGKRTLDRIATETGGRLFEVSHHETAAQIFSEIAEELRAQYRLGFTPDATIATDGYHQITLSLTKDSEKKDIVQTRDGYYTGKPARKK